ncbi:MAG: deoxynucleoside kinase [Saprospiraceae bacterium]|nr:deoxynucleoside kinase [Saprospiraceae bacterium]
MQYRFITIEGNIGAGKTTLAEMLAKEFEAELILEQFADNPFLPEFYKDQDRYAFPLELFFMAERYQQLQDSVQGRLFNNLLITDYLFSKSLLFAKTTLKQNELDLYMRLFRIIYASLPKPDLIVYLHNPVEKLIENIAKRGRSYEADIPPEYLESIEQAYFTYFKEIQEQQRIVIIDAKNMDFVHRDIDYYNLRRILSQEHKIGITYL